MQNDEYNLHLAFAQPDGQCLAGTARPTLKASNSNTPSGEPTPAAMPSSTTSAGVHAGQTATENEAPSATSPHVDKPEQRVRHDHA